MSIQSASYAKTNVLQIRGKMPVQVAGKQRAFGFKFMLPPDYPNVPPMVYLDEVENEGIVDMLDYLDKGNIISAQYIFDWRKIGRENPGSLNTGNVRYNLITLSSQVYNLFSKAPPVSFDEL